VTFGDVYDVDLNKQTIFPLSHIMINQASFEGQVVRMSVSLICMDVIDETKENPRSQEEPFYGTSNVQDILNTQLAVINDVVAGATQRTVVLRPVSVGWQPIVPTFHRAFREPTCRDGLQTLMYCLLTPR
jgi:hypothetical protein